MSDPYERTPSERVRRRAIVAVHATRVRGLARFACLALAAATGLLGACGQEPLPLTDEADVLGFEPAIAELVGDADTENATVVADAGGNRTVDPGREVVLDGSRSVGPDGSTLRFQWEQTAGPPIAIEGADSPVVRFLAPQTDVDVTLTFVLQVSDGTQSASDSVNVLVRAAIGVTSAFEIAITASTTEGMAGLDSIRLTATDPDGGEALPGIYFWEFGDGATAEGSRVDHVFAAAGTYSVVVCGSVDEGLLSQIACADIEITIVAGLAPAGGGGGGGAVIGGAGDDAGGGDEPNACTVDTDADGTSDCNDECPADPNKITPGACGCGTPDADADADGTADCDDDCPNDANKTEPGLCGCGAADTDMDRDGVPDCRDGCPLNPNKTGPGLCGCNVSDADVDGDGAPDCNDACPFDPNKTSAGVCGCGVADVDLNGDGTPDCGGDLCPNDPNKLEPGLCGCGVADTDVDSDGVPDCNDGCPFNPNKTAPGFCGCNVADTDVDGDGAPDCRDGCPFDSTKTSPGACGCGVADADLNGDGAPDCDGDACPNDANKLEPGLCGCGVADTDIDGDGVPDCNDGCSFNPNKTAPGLCGCNISDTDVDGDGTPDCTDGCPFDPNKSSAGVCGCGVPDADLNGDGLADCGGDACPNDPSKLEPGLCGCGVADTDSDSDGVPDCNDGCPLDPDKTAAGFCGCNLSDTDVDGDGAPDCIDGCPFDPDKTSAGACGCGVPDTDLNCGGDACPNDPNKVQPGICGCGVSDADSDGDGVPDCNDACPRDANKTTPGACGCGVSDADLNGDGLADCGGGGVDACPNDPNKVQPGLCGCGVPETDSDGDGTPDCNDACPFDANKTERGGCGCGSPDTDTDGDGTPDCGDVCFLDPTKVFAGACGCGNPDIDSDGDGVLDCRDGCPDDPTATTAADCPAILASRHSDWDLYMLRLVNRARQDPIGEAARIGSSVTDNQVPVGPLAYDVRVANAARNHNTWMHENFGSIASDRSPDSFTHYEAFDGQREGPPAIGTPGFTGVRVGARMTAAGFAWSLAGENILTFLFNLEIAVNRRLIDTNHRAWWESSSHRNNMLNERHTAFGHFAESHPFTPPRGNVDSPFNQIHYATQNLGRPLQNPAYYFFGVLYADRDRSGDWTPRDVIDPLREGLGDIRFNVMPAGTSSNVATGRTLDNGSFSMNISDGTYDVEFVDPTLPGGRYRITGITVAGRNTNAGDHAVTAGP